MTSKIFLGLLKLLGCVTIVNAQNALRSDENFESSISYAGRMEETASNLLISFDRYLQEQEGDEYNETSNGKSLKEKRDFYEFIAFICWYLFLIVCCIVPTVCAFRRRRNIERRALANLESAIFEAERDGGLANFFGAWSENERNRDRMSKEEAQKKRGIAIAACLNKTMIEVENHNIITPNKAENSECDNEEAQNCFNVFLSKIGGSVGMCSTTIGDDKQPNNSENPRASLDSKTRIVNKPTLSTITIATDLEVGESDVAINDIVASGTIENTSDIIDCVPTYSPEANVYGDDISFSDESSGVMLELPPIDPETGEQIVENDTSIDKRCVSISCAICLSSYDVGHKVVWSSNKNCPHVFHESCMATWLAKTEGNKLLCPCCRQTFVELPAATKGSGTNATLVSTGSTIRLQDGTPVPRHVWNAMMAM